MAKPKTRIDRSAIASMLGIAPATDRASDSTPSTESTPADIAPESAVDRREGEGLHPVRDRLESGVARAENALVLDPHRISQRGRYVRPFTEDQRFSELLNAIEEAGRTIHVPILVRVEGPPGAIEYVLVDGTHRLEAALRLGISVPAINLGRITPERAFAIQAMANEVRATMHVVDQAAYVMVLEAQGLGRDSIRRTTGFSAGRVSELAGLGKLLGTLSETDLGRARLAPTVTHRALRALKAAATDSNAFRRGVGALIAQAEAARDDENEVDTGLFRPDGSLKPADGRPTKELVSPRYQLATPRSAGRKRRGRATLEAGGVSFATTRNRRGTSVTFRMAWRARAIRQNPEAFIERVRDALRLIATEATAQYEALTALESPRSQSSDQDVGSFGGSWHGPLAESPLAAGQQDPLAPAGLDSSSDLVMPEWQNPMPLPASHRHPDDAAPEIDPRLLGGLSLPMLAGRLKRRSAEFKALEKQVSDAERKAEDTRQRVRGLIDTEDADMLDRQ
jgi:ParB-like chromosome segregation protein Spo0J